MTKEEKLICTFVYDFVNKNWDKINMNKCEIKNNKTKLLNKVMEDVDAALWVIFEVANWGMDKQYLTDIYLNTDEDDFHVLKIYDKYIKVIYDECTGTYYVSPAIKKTKTVTYWE